MAVYEVTREQGERAVQVLLALAEGGIDDHVRLQAASQIASMATWEPEQRPDEALLAERVVDTLAETVVRRLKEPDISY